MSAHSDPHDVKGFTVTTFIAFVVVFVFAMMMMLWHGSTFKSDDGKTHYETRVSEPTDGKGAEIF
ncbi:MAG TPA: hypothetical protein VHB70_02140 [Parafilimonas sp.]|nr:hypothetical protein [Parafilimonas sp.]